MRVNRKKYNAYQKEMKNKYRADWLMFFDALGLPHPSKMDYHHIQRKRFQIGKWIIAHSFTVRNVRILLNELAKTVPILHKRHGTLHGKGIGGGRAKSSPSP